MALGAEEGRGNAAKRSGEPLAGIEPDISEWGNPSSLSEETAAMRREPAELKHLSRQRKYDRPPSSGERTGACPNHTRVSYQALRVRGCKTMDELLVQFTVTWVG